MSSPPPAQEDNRGTDMGSDEPDPRDQEQLSERLTVPVQQNPPTRQTPIEENDQILRPPANRTQENVLQRMERSELEATFRRMPAETISRATFFFNTLYNSPDYRVEIRVSNADRPLEAPAVFSLEPEGAIMPSRSVDLDIKNAYSHYALQRPISDPTTNRDLEWVGKLVQNLQTQGVLFSPQGSPGMTIGRALNSTAAWFRDAQVVIVCEDLMGANENHIGALKRSVVLFRCPEITLENIQTIVNILAESMQYIEIIVVILPYPGGTRSTGQLQEQAKIMVEGAGEVTVCTPDNRKVKLAIAAPPKVGLPQCQKNFYASFIGQRMRSDYPTGEIKPNTFAIAPRVECGNAISPDGDVFLPHQFLRYLMDLNTEIAFVTNTPILYDENGAASLFQFMELILRARCKGKELEQQKVILAQLKEEELARPDLLTPEISQNNLRFNLPWENPALIATGSMNMAGVLRNFKNWTEEIRQMTEQDRQAFSWRLAVKPLIYDHLDPKDKQQRAAKEVMDMIRIGGKYLEFLDTPHEEQAWRAKKIALYSQSEWKLTLQNGNETVPRARLTSLEGWKTIAQKGVDGMQWSDLTLEDLIMTVACFGVDTFIKGPEACKQYLEQMKNDMPTKLTILALMPQKAITFLLGKPFLSQMKNLREFVAKSVLDMQLHTGRPPTLAEFIAATAMPLDALAKCMDQTVQAKLFGPQSQRPADYSTFLGSNLDCIFTIQNWIEGKLPRKLGEQEFPYCISYEHQFTDQGTSLSYNCLYAAINNKGFIYRLLGPAASDATALCLSRLREHHQKVLEIEEDRRVKEENKARTAYNYNKENKDKAKRQMVVPEYTTVRLKDLHDTFTNAQADALEPRTREQVIVNMTRRQFASQSSQQPEDDQVTPMEQSGASETTPHAQGPSATASELEEEQLMETDTPGNDDPEWGDQSDRLNNSGPCEVEPDRDSLPPAVPTATAPPGTSSQHQPSTQMEPPPGFEEPQPTTSASNPAPAVRPKRGNENVRGGKQKKDVPKKKKSLFSAFGEISDVSDEDPDALVPIWPPPDLADDHKRLPYRLTKEDLHKMTMRLQNTESDVERAIYLELLKEDKEREKIEERLAPIKEKRKKENERLAELQRRNRHRFHETSVDAEDRLTLHVSQFQQGRHLTRRETMGFKAFKEHSKQVRENSERERQHDKRSQETSQEEDRRPARIATQRPGPSRPDTTQPPRPSYRYGKDRSGFGYSTGQATAPTSFHRPLSNSFNPAGEESSKYRTWVPHTSPQSEHALMPPRGYDGPVPLSTESRAPTSENRKILDKWHRRREESNRENRKLSRRINRFGMIYGDTDYEAPYYIEWMPPDIEICVMMEDPDPPAGKWDYLRTFLVPSGKTKRLNPYAKDSGVNPVAWVTTWDDWCFLMEEEEQVRNAKIREKREKRKARRERFERRNLTDPPDTSHLEERFRVRLESPTPWYEKPTTTLVPWRGAGEYLHNPADDEVPSDNDWDPSAPTWDKIPKKTTTLTQYPIAFQYPREVSLGGTTSGSRPLTTGIALGRGRSTAEPDPKRQKTTDPQVGATHHAPDPRLEVQEVTAPITTLPPVTSLDIEEDTRRREEWDNRKIISLSDDEADVEVMEINVPGIQQLDGTVHDVTEEPEITEVPQAPEQQHAQDDEVPQNVFRNIEAQLPTPHLTEGETQQAPTEVDATTTAHTTQVEGDAAMEGGSVQQQVVEEPQEEVTPMEVTATDSHSRSTTPGAGLVLRIPRIQVDAEELAKRFPAAPMTMLPPPQGITDLTELSQHLAEQRVNPTTLEITIQNRPIIRYVPNPATIVPPEQRVKQGLIREQEDTPSGSRPNTPTLRDIPTSIRPDLSPKKSREISRSLTRHLGRLPTGKRPRSTADTTRHASQESRLYAEGKNLPRSHTAQQLTVPRLEIEHSIPDEPPRAKTTTQPKRTPAQEHEAKQIALRAKERSPRAWKGVSLKKEGEHMKQFRQMLEEQEKAKAWKSSEDLQPAPMIRIQWKEFAMLTRRTCNMAQVEYHKKAGLGSPEKLEHPEQGATHERWCLYCTRNLEILESVGRLAEKTLRCWTKCTCEPTMRYGTAEVHSNKTEAELVTAAYKSCRTFAEGLEFFAGRLNAQRFVEDVPAYTIVGAVFDRWRVHTGYSYKKNITKERLPTRNASEHGA